MRVWIDGVTTAAIYKHNDMCSCGHARDVHGGLDGHGVCFYGSYWTEHKCRQFTWAGFRN